ncbi:MAG: S4 domain-containing protein [Pseudomonadota bacterium]
MNKPPIPGTLRLAAKPVKTAASKPRPALRPGKAAAIPHAAKPMLDPSLFPVLAKPAADVGSEPPAARTPVTQPTPESRTAQAPRSPAARTEAAAASPKRPNAKPRQRPVTALRTKPPAALQAAEPQPQPQADTGDRLAKRVALMVPCSRSEAEQYVEGGWVKVNGQVIEEPQFRIQNQSITIDPNASLLELNSITIVMHKPADWIDGTEESLAKLNRNARRAHFDDARTLLVAAKHMAKDPSGIRMLQRHFKALAAAVPLENAASGLIVFTQDWRVERKLTEDMGSMEHEVIVDVQGEVTPQALHLLNRTLDSDENLPHAKVSINSNSPERSKLRFAIKGAHRGLIAYLCERAKLEILDMRRIRLGRVALSDLPVGQWRYLGAGEKF